MVLAEAVPVERSVPNIDTIDPELTVAFRIAALTMPPGATAGALTAKPTGIVTAPFVAPALASGVIVTVPS